MCCVYGCQKFQSFILRLIASRKTKRNKEKLWLSWLNPLKLIVSRGSEDNCGLLYWNQRNNTLGLIRPMGLNTGCQNEAIRIQPKRHEGNCSLFYWNQRNNILSLIMSMGLNIGYQNKAIRIQQNRLYLVDGSAYTISGFWNNIKEN